MFTIPQTSTQYSMLLHSNLTRMKQSKSWMTHPPLHLQLLPMAAIFQLLFHNLLPLLINHLHSSRHPINRLIQVATLLPLPRGDIHLLPKEHILLRGHTLPLLRGPTLPLQLDMASHHQEVLIFNLVLEGPEDLLFLSSKLLPLEKSTCSLVLEDLVCLQGTSPFRPTQHSLHHGHETEHCSCKYDL